MSLDELYNMVKDGVKEISVILKTDVKGSEEAVKKYQADHHLTVDGIIGKNTWSALYK